MLRLGPPIGAVPPAPSLDPLAGHAHGPQRHQKGAASAALFPIDAFHLNPVMLIGEHVPEAVPHLEAQDRPRRADHRRRGNLLWFIPSAPRDPGRSSWRHHAAMFVASRRSALRRRFQNCRLFHRRYSTIPGGSQVASLDMRHVPLPLCFAPQIAETGRKRGRPWSSARAVRKTQELGGAWQGTLSHGPAAQTHDTFPGSDLKRSGHTPGVPGPACGSACRRRSTPRSRGAGPCGSAARRRSPP